MQEAFYYINLNSQISGELTKDSRLSLKRELLVNCAGSINTHKAHKSNNVPGRADYYLIYVTEGNLFFSSCGTEMCLKPFDAIVLPPDTPYFQALEKSEELNYLWVHFTGKNVEGVLNQLGIKLFPHINKVNQNNHMQTRFQRLFGCFSKKDDFTERDLSASLEKLLIELARSIRTSENPRVSIAKSLGYINGNYNKAIKIPDLAKMDGLSMTQYNLHFKRQTGMSPTKYIIALRMNTAKELIETSDLPLVQISSMCGYEDYNFFAKVFKQDVGMSPRKYRKQ